MFTALVAMFVFLTTAEYVRSTSRSRLWAMLPAATTIAAAVGGGLLAPLLNMGEHTQIFIGVCAVIGALVGATLVWRLATPPAGD